MLTTHSHRPGGTLAIHVSQHAAPLATSRAGAAHVASRRPRRKELRVVHRVPCRLRFADAHTGRTVTIVAETVNVSRIGLAVQTSRDVPGGTRVEALVPRSAGEPLRIVGRVVRVRRVLSTCFELGIEADSAGESS